MMTTQGSMEQIIAKSMTNETLAHRVGMIRDNRRAFDKAQTDAFLDEAQTRLRWSDVYLKHR